MIVSEKTKFVKNDTLSYVKDKMIIIYWRFKPQK